ncbi:MAG TPA: hypothetical protein VHE83_17615 [Mycobacteriales bacterium]|nr:hypothetical protein [Mycobacteriales bacterium]
MGTPIALATCAALPDLDEDAPELLAALAAVGIDGQAAVWDDPEVDWTQFAAVVIRSTWDYVPKRDAFVAWASSLPVPVHNDAALLAWSTDKSYLRDLDAAGVPTVPTAWSPTEVPDDGRSWVVKPVVGAGAEEAAAYRSDQRADAAAHLRRLADAGKASMAQPFLARLVDEGETALVHFAGRFSHAVRKNAILEPGGGVFERPIVGVWDPREVLTPTAPTDAQLTVARAALSALPDGRAAPLYARVDVVPLDDGSPAVIELELVEPSLFLRLGEGSVERFAAAIAAAV